MRFPCLHSLIHPSRRERHFCISALSGGLSSSPLQVRHRHPGSVLAFVLKGTLRSQMEGGAAETYTTGQTWFEPPGALHLFAENVSKTEPAELLATFITDSNCGALVIPD